ncbi:DNA polymerase [Nitrosomonas eutropha]|uniref:Type-4 uracil-DNA glycosylase n=1 Tax=Nitrosomonas eutropha TaxID=916 RepID=A0A1I7EU00_9PROT|nr:uracil-DNA glycosylase [Nitrosomonas eutropha]SFU27417.1 DNA polymerase [Nitrosomonas eutropha]
MDPNRLKELGLLPVWRVRPGTISGQPSVQSSDSRECPTVHTETAVESSIVDDRSALIARANWEQLRQMVSSCTACPLCQTRKQTVFGVGDEQADWLFIGEGPGAREDALGEPFVGQAGKLLDSMLQAINLGREQGVYITNVVKCRPPDNRNPLEIEAQQCRPYLLRQIALIQPRLIVTLGKVAAQNLLATGDSIASLRGRLHEFAGIPLIATYHPAYLLRSLTDKAKAWEDLCFARRTMQTLRDK